jgi:peptide/nickel transport system substrate-binding protein
MNNKKVLVRGATVGFILLLLTFITLGVGAAGAEEKTYAGMEWGEKYWPTKPVRGGYLRSASPQYIGLMNPNHWPVNDWISIGYMYEKLIYTDGNYKPVVPWLAESWEYVDPVTVVMKLRQGVQFHDGSTFEAEGLKYQIDWILEPKNGAWTRAWMEPLESIEVVDTYTVKWHFKRPWAGFLGVMSNVPGYVLSAKALKGDVALKETKIMAQRAERARKKAEEEEAKAKEAAAAGGEAAEKTKARAEKARQKAIALEEEAEKTAALAKDAKELDNNPVGTGPYMLEEGNPGNYLKLKRNPNWWFGKFIGRPEMPYFDGIKVSVIPDPSVRLANLRAGKLDSMAVDPPQYPMIKNDRNLQVFVYPLNWLIALRFNLAKGPCKDIRVRKAISHAIDRKALIAGVAFGLGREASCNYPDDHWTYNPDLKPVSYDPELSKKLLAEAGYEKGLTVKGYMLNITTSQTLAEAVKGMLAQVGIDWKVELLDSAAISEKLRTMDYDLAGGGWYWIYDPDLLATGLYHPDGGFNFGRSHNEKAIALIEEGRKEVDLEKRAKIYMELEKVLYDNYEDAWLWWPMAVTVFGKNVLGWNHDMYLKFREAQYYSHPMWFKDGHP